MMPQSPSKQVPWDLTQFSQLPSAASLCFPESHRQSEISSLAKVILVLGKTRSFQVPSLGCWGSRGRVLSHLGDLMFVHEMWCMSRRVLLWGSCQSPVAHSCSLLNHPKRFRAGKFKLNAKFDADLLLYLLSQCDGHTVHMLTQQHLPPPLTSTVKSSLFTHAHSSPCSLAARLHRCHINCSHYINNGWTSSRQTSCTQKVNLDINLTLFTKLISKWITDPNVRWKTIKFLEGNI